MGVKVSGFSPQIGYWTIFILFWLFDIGNGLSWKDD